MLGSIAVSDIIMKSPLLVSLKSVLYIFLKLWEVLIVEISKVISQIWMIPNSISFEAVKM